jgi:hypothetical protein
MRANGRLNSDDDQFDEDSVGGAFHALREEVLHEKEDDFTLIADANAFAAAKELYGKKDEILKKIKTISGNADIEIRKCELQIQKLVKQLGDFTDANDNALHSEEFHDLENAKRRAEIKLEAAKTRRTNVNTHIPIAELALAEARKAQDAAAEKFICHFPALVTYYTWLYRSYLGVDLLFTAYTIKTAGLSLTSFATAWGLPAPSDFAALAIALTPAIADTFFNILMFDPRAAAIETVFELYNTYGVGLKPIKTIIKDILRDMIKSATIGGVTIGALHWIVILTHNLLGAAADIVGIDDFDFYQDMPWQAQLFIGILIVAAGNGYYGLSQNQKYFNGVKDGTAYRQLASSFRKILSGDFPRAIDVLYRGLFCSSILRGLSFYYLADSVSKMSPSLSWINPVVSTILVTHHTICVRYGVTYMGAFGAKEVQLPKIFHDIKIEVEREEIITERVKASLILEDLTAANRQLRHPKSASQLLIDARVIYLQRLTKKESAELDDEALIRAANLLPVPADAELSAADKQAHAKERIEAMARMESDLYLKRQTIALKEITNWDDFRKDLWNSSVIALLRGAFAGTLMSEYGMLVVSAIADNDTLSAGTFETIKVTSSIGVGLLASYIYFQSVRQSALDKKALACFTKDDLVEVVRGPTVTVAGAATEEKEEKSAALPSQILLLPPPVNNELIVAGKTNVGGMLKLGAYLAVGITIGSCAIRLISSVEPTIFSLQNKLNYSVLVTSVTLSLAEQQANGYDVFLADVTNTINLHLRKLSCFNTDPSSRREFERQNLSGSSPAELLTGKQLQSPFGVRLLKRWGFLPATPVTATLANIPLEEMAEANQGVTTALNRMHAL